MADAMRPLASDLDPRLDVVVLARGEDDTFLPVEVFVFGPDFIDFDAAFGLLLEGDFADFEAPPAALDREEAADLATVDFFAVDDLLADDALEDFAFDDLDFALDARDEPDLELDDFEDPDFEPEDFLVAGICIPPITD